MAILVFVFLIYPWRPVHAQVSEFIVENFITVASHGALTILSLLGRLMGFVIDMILTVASYNDFIKAPAVVAGWKVVRDLGNMTFIIALLMIGFGTMFGLQKFEIGQWLPKVALFSILVNFSRTICGVLIDASQVVMLTFVNAFKEAGAGNFVNAMGLDKIVALAENKAEQGGEVVVEVLIAILLGVIVTTLALGVLGALLAFLLERVIGLWILVTLSPIAFILKAIPLEGAANLASQWWKKFLNYLTSGPILAFFLWLALAISSGVGPEADKNLAELQGFTTGQSNAQSSELGEDSLVGPGDLISGIGNAQGLLSFIISAAMLVAGMAVAKKSGSFAGAFATSYMKKATGLGKSLGGYLATGGPAGAWVGRTAKGFAKPLQEAWKGYQAQTGERGQRWGLGLVGTLAGERAVFGGTVGRKAQKELQQKRADLIDDDKKRYKSDEKTDEELKNIIEGTSANQIEKLSAIEELLRRNVLKEDNDANRAATNQSRKLLEGTPELLKAFDEKIMKASPELAGSTIFNGISNIDDANAVFTAISTGQIELSKVLSKFSFKQVEALVSQIGSKEEFHTRVRNGTKDVGEYKQLVSGLNTERRRELFDGKEDTFDIIGERYYKGFAEPKDASKFWNDVENDKIDLASALKGFSETHVDKLKGTPGEQAKAFQDRIAGAVKDVKEYMSLVNALPKDRQDKVFDTRDLMEAVGGQYYMGFKDDQGKVDPRQVDRLKADVEGGRIDFSDFIKGLKDLPLSEGGGPGVLEKQLKDAFQGGDKKLDGYDEMMKFMAENAKDTRYFVFWLNNMGKTKANRITGTKNTMEATTKYMYSDFRDATQVDKFRTDVESGRVNLKEFLGDIPKETVQKMAGAFGGYNKLGKFLVDQSWDTRQLENIIDAMDKESVQTIIDGIDGIGGMSPEEFAADEDEERLKFGLATRGRFDKSFNLKDPKNIEVLVEHIQKGDIKGADVINLKLDDLEKAVKPDDLPKILEAMVRSFDSRSFAIIERNGDEALLNRLLDKVADDLNNTTDDKIFKRAVRLKKGLIKANVIDDTDPKYKGPPGANNPTDKNEDEDEDNEEGET